MTARDELHSVLAGPLRSVKYQLLSRVARILVNGHLHNVAEHTDVELPAGNERGEKLRCIYTSQDLLPVHPRCTRPIPRVMSFLQKTNAVLPCSRRGIPMERGAAAQGSC